MRSRRDAEQHTLPASPSIDCRHNRLPGLSATVHGGLCPPLHSHAKTERGRERVGPRAVHDIRRQWTDWKETHIELTFSCIEGFCALEVTSLNVVQSDHSQNEYDQ